MNNLTSLGKKVCIATIDFLTESGDSPEQSRTRSERAKARDERSQPKAECSHAKETLTNRKKGSKKALILSYIAFLIPFILVTIQQYYEVKRGDEAAGAGLLLMSFGAYAFFVTLISQKISNFISVIRKVHLAFWITFAFFSLNILLQLNYNHISTDFLVCVGINAVILGGLKYIYLLLKKRGKLVCKRVCG